MCKEIAGQRRAICGDRTQWRIGRPRDSFSVAVIVVLAMMSGCGYSDDNASQKINGSIHVLAGKPGDAVATVNGEIKVDDNAAVTTAATVNGAVHLGAHATAVSLKTVNGSITLDAGAHVAADTTSVNGALALRDGSEVSGRLSNVNGEIELDTAHVAGGIKTVNGSISINGNSRVEGGILVEKPSNGFFHAGNDTPRIVIGPGAVVQGELRFEREVKLYVSDKASIGPVSGATPIQYSGDKPPA